MKIIDQSIYAKLAIPFPSILEDGNANDNVSFFIHTTTPLTGGQVQQLRDAGCNVPQDAESRTITTAQAKLVSVAQIATLDFIKYLRPSTQLQPKV